MTLDGEAIPNTCLMASMAELPKLVNNPMTLPAEENTPLPNAEIKLTPISLRFPPLLKIFIALPIKLPNILVTAPPDANTPLLKEEIKFIPMSLKFPPLPKALVTLVNRFLKIGLFAKFFRMGLLSKSSLIAGSKRASG